MAVCVQGCDDASFLRGRKLGKDRRRVRQFRERRIVDFLDLGAEHDTAGIEVYFPADFGRYDFIIAREDLHRHTGGMEGGNGGGCAVLRRVEKRDVAEERQIAFVFDGVAGLRLLEPFVSDGHDPEAVLVQVPHLFLGLIEVSCIQVSKFAIEFIMAADGKDLFDRTLAYESVRAVLGL